MQLNGMGMINISWYIYIKLEVTIENILLTEKGLNIVTPRAEVLELFYILLAIRLKVMTIHWPCLKFPVIF